MVQDLEAARALKGLYKRLGTWRAVADHLGVNVGLVHKVAHGKTRSAKVRSALGLPALLVEVMPCACGHVHAESCATGRQIARRARSSDPELLEKIQQVVVPWLTEREHVPKNGVYSA